MWLARRERGRLLPGRLLREGLLGGLPLHGWWWCGRLLHEWWRTRLWCGRLLCGWWRARLWRG
ncbi:hypothetical protein ADK67_11520 [Saccharothrix sp. NRRL B-16348]|nr:hypothetical protein ADK67_11520 [Saccharothrix sp. NRRL B-16348]